MLRKLINYQSFLKRTCSMRKIAIFVAILLFVLSTPLLADILGTDINGKPVILRSDGTWFYIKGDVNVKICHDYANDAIAQQRANLSRGCGFAGVRWHLDYNKHYKGCLMSGAQWSVRETNLRKNALNLCKICRDYANDAIAQQRANLSRGCGFAGVRWHLDYNKHYKGCLMSGAQWSVGETNIRKNALNLCAKTPSSPPPVGGVLPISVQELTNTVWQFGRGDGSVISKQFRLLPDGRIGGYSHPNESRWGIEGNMLVFYHSSGKHATHFTSFRKGNGRWVISGPFPFAGNGTHVLRQMP